MSNTKLVTVALLALSQSAFAQMPYGAGGQLQQIPPTPMQQRPVPEIRIQQGGAPAAPSLAQTRILVQALRVTGQSLYSEADLIAISGFTPGRQLSLAELRGMATRIADHYHKNGYFVAQAYLPAQNIKDGTVTIAVLEGRYGNVTLRNSSRLYDSVATGLLAGLNSGDIIAITPIENRLLLLSDIPGVNVKSTLTPGTAVGTSDLIVDMTPGQAVTGSIEADNAGNRYTGRYRLGATVNFNNVSGRGDVITLRGLTTGSGLMYGRASYQMPVGKATVGVAYTGLSYRLGEEFASLQAHGTAEIMSIYGSYPLIRSRNSNLYALAGFDYKTFQDKIDVTSPPTVVDKNARVGMVGLHGNHRDNLGGGGLNNYLISAIFGEIDIRTPAALAVDEVTARTNGSFSKLAYSASRAQRVTDTFSLYGAINGQFASKNLDISEKMGLGGMYAVRAYPVGEAYADEGYFVNLEARLLLPKFSRTMPGQMHLIGFVDTGSVELFANPWLPGIDNHRTLSGAGVGLTWADYNNFVVNMYWAAKLGNEKAVSAPDQSSRFWIQVIKYF